MQQTKPEPDKINQERFMASTSAGAKPEGLRARKRRATENAIETSAVRLALELGVENVTVEAICDRAGISRSTFFNYFQARDYAIVGRAVDIPIGDEAFAVLDSSPDNLPLGVLRLVFAAIGHAKVNTEVAQLRAKLVTEQPEAGRMFLSTLIESAFQIITPVSAWLLARPEHAKLDSPGREATLAVSLAHGALSAQMLDWVQSEGDLDASEDDLLQMLDHYKTLLA